MRYMEWLILAAIIVLAYPVYKFLTRSTALSKETNWEKGNSWQGRSDSELLFVRLFRLGIIRKGDEWKPGYASSLSLTILGITAWILITLLALLLISALATVLAVQ